MILYIKKIYIMFTFMIFILCTLTIANATPDDAPDTTPHLDCSLVQKIHVNKNGACKINTCETKKINTQHGADTTTVPPTSYDPQTGNATRKVLVNGRPCKTEKLTTGNPQTSSQETTLTTHLPRLHIGDTITEYVDETRKPELDFCQLMRPIPTAEELSFVDRIKKFDYTLTSELPIQFDINDPDGIFNVERKDAHTLRITNKRPFVQPLTGRPDHPTAFYVSTAPSYAALNKAVSVPFDKELTKKHPPHVETIIQDIAQQALQKTTDVDRINCATNLISQRITYLAIDKKGERLAPHTLDHILTKGRGDCKDMATLFTAVLRKMGYDAWPVAIKAGEPDVKTTIPVEGYNHAIVKVLDKNGKTYWLDTTSGISMADIVPSSMQDKKVLVMDGKSDRETIPVNTPKEHRHTNHAETTIDFETGHTQTDIKKSWKGNPSYDMHCLFYNATSDLEKKVILGLDPKTTVQWPDITRIGKDITFSTHRKSRSPLTGSNAGYVWNEFVPFHGPTECHKDRRRDCPLTVGTQEYTRILKNARIDNGDRLNYTFESDWMDQSRTVEQKGPDVHITEHIVCKKPKIPLEQWQSQAFQDKVKKCGNRLMNMAAIVKPYAQGTRHACPAQ